MRTGVVDFVMPSELLSPVSVDVVSASPFGAEGGGRVVEVVEVVEVVDGIVVEVVELDVVVVPGAAVEVGTYPQPDRTTVFRTVTDPMTFDATRTRN